MLRRLTVTAVVASVVLAAAGCLTPLTSLPPLAPVPASANPLVGVYEPGAPGSWSQIAEFADATGVKPGIVARWVRDKLKAGCQSRIRGRKGPTEPAGRPFDWET